MQGVVKIKLKVFHLMDLSSKYEVGIEVLGSGNFGVVLAGRSRADGREVAMKMIPLSKVRSTRTYAGSVQFGS